MVFALHHDFHVELFFFENDQIRPLPDEVDVQLVYDQ